MSSAALWGWFEPKHWYAVQEYQPLTARTYWYGPFYLTRQSAADWQLDVQEANWNSQTTLWQWDGAQWQRA